MRQAISDAVGAEKTHFVDATRLATRLLGDSIATNLFLLGFAYQQGLLPISAEAIEKAIELNGVAAKLNLQAFAGAAVRCSNARPWRAGAPSRGRRTTL